MVLADTSATVSEGETNDVDQISRAAKQKALKRLRKAALLTIYFVDSPPIRENPKIFLVIDLGLICRSLFVFLRVLCPLYSYPFVFYSQASIR